MKGTVAIAILALFGFAGAPLLAHATTASHGHDQAITGCLENGVSPGQYKLMGQDGNTWTVDEGQYVNLSPYVGETVTVAGPEARSHHSSKTEGRLKALDVAVDGQSCNR